jgi:pyruvate-formate lyase-activating enzyme
VPQAALLATTEATRMAQFSQIHLLLTYQCPFECQHCFVWGSPFQTGTMTIAQVREVFRHGEQVGGRYVSIEGGEPFLYYATAVACQGSAIQRNHRHPAGQGDAIAHGFP